MLRIEGSYMQNTVYRHCDRHSQYWIGGLLVFLHEFCVAACNYITEEPLYSVILDLNSYYWSLGISPTFVAYIPRRR